jgi:hypothetical protein
VDLVDFVAEIFSFCVLPWIPRQKNLYAGQIVACFNGEARKVSKPVGDSN